MKGILEKRKYESDFELWCRCYSNIKFLAHYHTDVEMIYVRDGNPQILVNNHLYSCAPGDLMIFKSGDIHYNENDQSSNILDFVVFNPIILGELYSSKAELSPCLTHAKMQEYGMDADCLRLFNTIHEEMKDKRKYYEAAIKSRLRSFWVDYLRHFTVEVSDGSSPSVTINKLSRIRKLLDYIDLHYDTDIPLTKAAEILGYDAFHCSKTFKAITGVSFITYLNTVRIGKSLDMLKNDDRNILDIALDCGFNNARTFNRFFKEITQMTPSEYLQSMQQEHPQERDDTAQNHTIISYTDSWL